MQGREDVLGSLVAAQVAVFEVHRHESGLAGVHQRLHHHIALVVHRHPVGDAEIHHQGHQIGEGHQLVAVPDGEMVQRVAQDGDGDGNVHQQQNPSGHVFQIFVGIHDQRQIHGQIDEQGCVIHGMHRTVIPVDDHGAAVPGDLHSLIKQRRVTDGQNKHIERDPDQEGAHPNVAVHLEITQSGHAHGNDPGQEAAAQVAELQPCYHFSVVAGGVHHQVRRIDQRNHAENNGHMRVQVFMPAVEIDYKKHGGHHGNKNVIDQLERHHTTSFPRYHTAWAGLNAQSGRHTILL